MKDADKVKDDEDKSNGREMPPDVQKHSKMRRHWEWYDKWLLASDQHHLPRTGALKYSNMKDYMRLYLEARKADPWAMRRALKRKETDDKSNANTTKGTGTGS